jgi:hypothetical protein
MSVNRATWGLAHHLFSIEKWQPQTPKHTKAFGTWNARKNASALPPWQTVTYTKHYLHASMWWGINEKARYFIVLTRCQCLVCVDQKDAFTSCGHVASSHSCFRCSSRYPLTLVVFGRAGTWAVPFEGGSWYGLLARPEPRHDTKYFGPRRHDTNTRVVPRMARRHFYNYTIRFSSIYYTTFYLILE